MKSNEPLRMLPKFDSQSNSIYKYEKIQLPRFYSDENQSADAAIKTISETKINIDHSNKFDIKFLERAHDRSGKKCWPMVNTNIGKIDLEYTYEIVGNTLESYIRCRKLNRCKALSNFIEYRNKVFKREKIAQYALPESKRQMKEINIPTKIIHIEEEQTPSVSPSPSTISETISSTPIQSSQSITPVPSSKSMTPIPSVQSITPKKSQKLSPPTAKEAFIPIPSPDLLRSPTPKHSKINNSKKSNANIKKISSTSVKNQS